MAAKRKLLLTDKQPWISGKRCPENIRRCEIRRPNADREYSHRFRATAEARFPIRPLDFRVGPHGSDFWFDL